VSMHRSDGGGDSSVASKIVVFTSYLGRPASAETQARAESVLVGAGGDGIVGLGSEPVRVPSSIALGLYPAP
jgi:hypothetical protein